ncbi:GGDEF domain-containing protein [Clostridium sp. CTA-5]
MDLKTIFIIKVLAFISIFIYNIKSFKYSETIIKSKNKGILIYIIVSILNLFLLNGILKFNIPIAIINICCIITFFIEFIILFNSKLLEKFFGSGNFILHIMLLRLIVLCAFSIWFKCSMYEIINNEFLYYNSIFITMILCMIFLSIFKRLIDSEKIELIVKHREQLKYLSIAVAIMNIYLIIISILYEFNTYKILSPLFFLATSLMIFLAFYTVFNHGIKMSLMIEYKQKSTYLENELVKNKENQEKLKSVIFIDELTGIYNRRYAITNLNKLILKKQEFCVCFIDIDGLKYVNDIFGHNEGDEYIKFVVENISTELSDNDKFCRVGGDEFLILSPYCSNMLAEKKAHRIFEKINRETNKTNKDYKMSISYGIVHIKAGESYDIDNILELADKNMYKFKKARKKIRQSIEQS